MAYGSLEKVTKESCVSGTLGPAISLRSPCSLLAPKKNKKKRKKKRTRRSRTLGTNGRSVRSAAIGRTLSLLVRQRPKHLLPAVLRFRYPHPVVCLAPGVVGDSHEVPTTRNSA